LAFSALEAAVEAVPSAFPAQEAEVEAEAA
jgi:hypothetical protein